MDAETFLPVVIFDIDGTVAVRGDRDPYDMTRVGEDLVRAPVMRMAQMVAASGIADVMFVTGRDTSALTQTCFWLAEHFGSEYMMKMRAKGDNRADAIVKQEIMEKIAKHREIIAVFDDRNQVVDMWRANGYTCFQVCSREDGDF